MIRLFEEIYDISHKQVKKISGPWGSNPGGLYKIDGVDYYVKFPDDPDIAKIEVLANKIYKLLGVYVPTVELIDYNGKIGLTSEMVDLLEANYDEYMEILSDHADTKDNFVIDAWLANWDVAGESFDSKNILLDKDKRALRIDQGGALSRRAQGAPKGSAFGETVGEIDSLRGDRATTMARKTFKKVNSDSIKNGLKKLRDLDISKLKELIDEYAPEDEKESLYITLLKRRDYILKNY
jgi:hypothetical protein